MVWLKKILKFLAVLIVLGTLAGVIGTGVVYLYLEPNLPSIDKLKEVRLQVPLRVYSRDRKLLAEYGEKRRIPLAYEQIPSLLRQAFLAAEDDRFFEHPGVDYQGLLRAATQLALTGKRRQGGSTITMQVARNFFLSREKTFVRKLREIFLALRIEKELSKHQILELYLNKIYLGQRAYGVGAAAQVYYGKTVAALDLAQIAMIAGLPKAPSKSNPVTSPARAIQRRDYVLGRMRGLGFITAQQYRQARAARVSASIHAPVVEVDAHYLTEMVRTRMLERFGDGAYTDGYHVITTLDSRLQRAANVAVREALQAYDRRHGYRGPAFRQALDEGTDETGWARRLAMLPPVAALKRALAIGIADKSVQVFTGSGERLEVSWKGLAWARPWLSEDRMGATPKRAADILKPGDLVYLFEDRDENGNAYWRLAQVPAVEGALVALDPDTGAMLALTGGYDFFLSKFNRVTQARRQPGSGFKAFIYSAALEAGFTPASLINDAPLVVDDVSLEGAWRPENYSGKFFGPTRLRKALYKSRNLVSIRLLRAMGIEHALKHIERFGFDTGRFPRNLSLALGSGEVTPLEMARGYAVLANGGFLIEPFYIESILDSKGAILSVANPARVCDRCDAVAQAPVAAGVGDAAHWAPRAISPQNQYLMVSMMEDVIRRGTGRRARALGRKDLAGKTGTTNDQRDAWFSGFNRGLVAVAWVGFDDFKPLGRRETGGRAALPAWMAFMRQALEGVPARGWDMPKGMVTVRIDPRSGRRARAGQKDAVFEVFRKAHQPKALAGTHTPQLETGADDNDMASDLF